MKDIPVPDCQVFWNFPVSKFVKAGLLQSFHCVKYARIHIFTDQYFPVNFPDSVLLWEKVRQRKTIFCQILHSAYLNLRNQSVSTKFIKHKILENLSSIPFVNICFEQAFTN